MREKGMCLSGRDETSDEKSTSDIVERLRDRTTLRYMGDCKCGQCQLVPRPLVVEAVTEIARQRAEKDSAYFERNQVVAALASVFPSGIARTDIPGWLPEWHGCVYIDLPTGQASWHYHDSQAHLFAHLPPYAGQWDGHTTKEKYARLAAFARDRAPAVLASARRPITPNWSP